MILYKDKSKESMHHSKKNPPRNSQLNKVIEYKMNILKSTAFLHTSSAHMNTKIKNTAPFTITQKTKCLV